MFRYRDFPSRPRVEVLEDRRLLAAFLFDADGPGPLAAQLVNGLDFDPGDALADNAAGAAVGSTFQLYFQARLGGVIDTTNTKVVPPGLNATFEITVVASVTETLTSVSAFGTPTAFSLSPLQAVNSFIRILFDSTPDANPLAGTGFDDGAIILSSFPTNNVSNAGSFTPDLTPAGGPVLVTYDQFGPDNYPGIRSVQGTGNLSLGGDVFGRNAAFFQSVLGSIAFATTIAPPPLLAPFTLVDPSAVYFDGTAVPFVADVGPINGVPRAVSDFATQPDANATATVARIDLVKLTNGTDNNAPPGPIVPVGSTVTFTYNVTNTGDTPLLGLQVTDDNGTPGNPADDFNATPVLAGAFNVGDANINNVFDPGETWQFTATRVATPGQYTNTATARARTQTETSVTDTDVDNHFGGTPAVNIVKFVNGQDANAPTGPHVQAGSSLTFTYVVTNTGNVPLSNVVVTDDKLGTIAGPASGDTNNNGLLDLTETWTYTQTAIAQPGQQTNVGTVTARDAPGTIVTDTDPANYFGDAPAVNIVKFVNGQDANAPTGPFVAAGNTLTFTYVVTNTGNVPLANVLVTDDKLGAINSFTGDTNNNGLLDLTETWTYTQTAAAQPGQQTNVGTVTARDANNPPGTTVTDTDPANYFGTAPAINLVKLTNGTDNDVPPGVFVPVGSTVTFTYIVTNPGNVPLSNVTVRDDNGTPGNPADDFNATFVGGDANANGLLDTNETWTFTATRIATPGQFTNHALVTGRFNPTETTVFALALDNHFGGIPAINIVKLTNGTDNNAPTGPLVPVGSIVVFTYNVTNPGNVPLANVTVRDDNGTPGNPADDFSPGFASGDSNANGLLDPGETWTYTASRIATPGQYTNISTATGTPPAGLGPPITDTDPDNHFGALPVINLVKLTNGTDNNAPTGPFVPVGSTVTFTYIVTNPGNVPLSNVTVRDDNGTPGNPGDDFNATFTGGDANANGLLDVGETWTFTATRIATPGQFTNLGTASGTPPTGAGPPVTDTDPDNHFGAVPGIRLVKLTNGTDNNAPTGPLVPVGSTVTFTYIVSNTGNVPLSGVSVRDDNGTPGNPADDFNATFTGGDSNANGLLDTNEIWTYTATRTATPGQYTNIATATGTPPPGAGPPVTATNPDNHFGAVPIINVVKLTNGTDNNAAPGLFVPVGSLVTFTYIVTNPGNVPLSGVTVVDNNGTPGNLADDFNATFISGDANANGLLDTNEIWGFTASRIATPGQYTNLGTASGTPPPGAGPPVTDTDPDNHFGAIPAINIVKLTNGTDNNVAPGLFVPAGSAVTFTYIVTNPGNVPLFGVTVLDDNGTPGTPGDDFNPTFTGGDTNGNGLLDPGEAWTYTAARIATPGQYTNVATTTGTPPPGAGAPVTDSDPDNHFGATPAINVLKLTNGTDNNAAPGLLVPVGSLVTFTYIVTNPGNVPLSNVTLVDDNGPAPDFNITFVGGDINANGLLDTNETWTYTASEIATPGQYTNIATATGTPPPGAGPPVTDSDPENHFGAAPAINVVKRTNGTDNNAPPGPLVPVGSLVTFTYSVTNPGNVPLSGVTVVDDNGTPGNLADDFNATFVSGDTNANGLLDTGETWTFTASRIATPGQYTNLATATGTPPPGGGPPVTDTDPDNHFGAAPAINVVKLTNGTDNNAPPGPLVPAGSLVTYTYIVTNPGNVPLVGVSVRDDNGTPGNLADDFNAAFAGGDANANGLLDTGETWTFTAIRVATPGQYTNLATATGTPPPGGGGPVTATDPDNHFGSAPGINLVKLTNGTDNNAPTGPFVPAGTTVTFTYVVTNTGNVPLSGIVVRDDNGTPGNLADDFNATLSSGDTNANGLLDTNETWTFTATRVATPGQYTNHATASGTPPPGGGSTVTDTDPDNHFGSVPGINVVKRTNGTDNNSAPGPFVPVGSTVTFLYEVTNTGNVPLSGVVVRDDNGTPGNLADDFNATFVSGDTNANGLLDTNETWTYTASRVATPGQYTNLATATGTPPTGGGPAVTDTDPDNHFGSAPGINVVKRTNGTDNNSAPGPFVPVGSTVTFTYTVTNTGNVPLSGVVVRDDNGTPGNLADDLNPTLTSGDTNGNGLLDTSETWTFTATRIATPGQYTNLATVTGSPPFGGGPGVSDTDPDNHFGSAPGISLVKLTNGNDNANPQPFVPVGSPVTFTYIVTNTGNVPLSGVVVRDDNGTPGNPADDFNATLASGDTNNNGLLDTNETWTFTATRNATAGQYQNVATASGTPPLGGGVAAAASDVGDYFGGTPGINVVKRTNGTDNNSAPGPLVPVGSTVTFTYTVTNTGNVPLSGVFVRDDNGTPGNAADDFNPALTGGDTNGNGLLDTTETWTFSATHVATPGQYTNLATVTGTPPQGVGPAVTDTDTDNHFGTAPGIKIVKLTNGTDNNSPPGPFLPVGSKVTFTYIITNTGNVPLAGLAVRDDNATPADPSDDLTGVFVGGDTDSDGLLETNETWTYTASKTVTPGQHTNIATVTVASIGGVSSPPAGGGNNPPGGNNQFAALAAAVAAPLLTATDPDNHFGSAPGIKLVKLTNGTDNNEAPGISIPAGSPVTFTYLVTNTGNVPLTGIVVSDDNGTPGDPADDFQATFVGGDTNGNGLLDLTETWSFQATRTAVVGQYSNVGTATGTTSLGGSVTVSDPESENYFGTSAGIQLVKLTNGTDNNSAPGLVVPVGSTVVFTYHVTNPSDVPLSNVTVRDDNGTPGDTSDDFSPTFVSGDANGNLLLDPGETWTFTASRVARAGQYTNVGTATGTPPSANGAPVSATDVENHFGRAVVRPSTFVTGLRRVGVHLQPTRLVLSFNGPLNPAQAQNPLNYSVVIAGPDGRLGTRDDRRVAIRSALYDPTTRTVTLRTAQLINLHSLVRLTVLSTLTDATGRPLDGDHNGVPGGNFVATFRGLVGSSTVAATRAASVIVAPSPSAVDALLSTQTRLVPRGTKKP